MDEDLKQLYWRYRDLATLGERLGAESRACLFTTRTLSAMKRRLPEGVEVQGLTVDTRAAQLSQDLATVGELWRLMVAAVSRWASDEALATAHDWLRAHPRTGYGHDRYTALNASNDRSLKRLAAMLQLDQCGCSLTPGLIQALACAYLDKHAPPAVAANARQVLATYASSKNYADVTRPSRFCQRDDEEGVSSDGRGVQYAGGSRNSSGDDEPSWQPSLTDIPEFAVNPMSGLPMIAGTPIDAGGNVFGTGGPLD